MTSAPDLAAWMIGHARADVIQGRPLPAGLRDHIRHLLTPPTLPSEPDLDRREMIEVSSTRYAELSGYTVQHIRRLCRTGRLPGYLMNRGTIVTMDGSDALSPTFVDSGVHELLATVLMARYVETYSPEIAAMLRRPWRRLLGDMAVIGKGEIFSLSVAN